MRADAIYYRNGLHCVIHTVQNEGFFALYRGLAVRLAYAVPSAAVNFTYRGPFSFVSMLDT